MFIQRAELMHKLNADSFITLVGNEPLQTIMWFTVSYSQWKPATTTTQTDDYVFHSLEMTYCR